MKYKELFAKVNILEKVVKMLRASKRRINVQSENEFSDEYDSEDHSDDTSYSVTKKISSSNPKKLVKQYNSSEMNKQFQPYSQFKMATEDEEENIKEYQNCSARKRKCFSKNALMARENRLKKKIYVQNLEKSLEKHKNLNKKLYSCINNQSVVINKLNKEIKYFKSILVNSQSIGKLLRCINENTGMPASTSLTNNKPEKTINSLHPWTDENLNGDITSVNGEFNTNDYNLESNLNWNVFSDFNSTAICNETELEENLKLFDDNFELPKEVESTSELYNEHNYTSKSSETEETSDVGICLHISNQRVSLEFCPICSDKASSVWEDE